jgi:hypothetical protein
MSVDDAELAEILPLAREAFSEFRECFQAVRGSLRFSSDEGRKITKEELKTILPELQDAIVSLANLYAKIKEASDD